MATPVDSSASLPDESTQPPGWLLAEIAAFLPIAVFVVLIQLAIGVASRFPPVAGPFFLVMFGVLFSLVPGIAALAPRITGSERTGRWAMAAVALFVGGALTRRLLDEFSLSEGGRYGQVNVPWEFIQTFVPGIFLGVGVYIAARVGWSFMRRGEWSGLFLGFAVAGVVALAFAGIDYLAFVLLSPMR